MSSRQVFWLGVGAYLVSFGLPAVVQPPLFGFACAIAAFTLPFESPQPPNVVHDLFFENPLGYPLLFTSGLANIMFPCAALLKFAGLRRAFVVTRTIVLLTIPCSWLVFVFLRTIPREGHLVWIGGMIVALFSDEIAARR